MTKLALKQQTHDLLFKLNILSDQMRVRLHRAATDLKQKWNEFEPQLISLELSAHTPSPEILKSLHELTAKIEELEALLNAR